MEMADIDREPTMDDVRRHPANAEVLERVEGGSAHGDLAEVLVRYVRDVGGLTLIEVGSGWPAIVAARQDASVVAYVVNMRELVLQVDTPPEDARLGPELLDELGAGWWRVNPFSADVTIPDTDSELRRWFANLA